MANKSFMVVDGELRLKITPESGWYCVEGLDIRGLVTQGRTIEEAIYMAHDAAKALAESRAIMAAQKAAAKKAAAKKKTHGIQKESAASVPSTRRRIVKTK